MGQQKEQSQEKKEAAAFITSRDTLDGAYPGLILGINARRLGMQCKVFYTFMGIMLFAGFTKDDFIKGVTIQTAEEF